MNKTLTTKLLVTLLIVMGLFSSCSLTKRRYNKGFHVDWFASNASTPKSHLFKTDQITSDTTLDHLKIRPISSLLSQMRIEDPVKLASNFGNLNFAQLQAPPTLLKLIGPDSTIKLDKIILINGDTLLVHIVDFSESQVSYEFLPINTGPLFIRNTNDIAKLIYASGTEMSFDHSVVRNLSNVDDTNVLATTSAILGIIAVLLFFLFPFLSVFLSIMAIVLGSVGLRQSRELPNEKGSGLAILGISLGILILAVSIMLIFLISVFILALFGL